MVNLLNKLFDSGILVCGISTLWEYTNGCAKKYRCYLAIYLMTVLSSSYVIIMYHGTNVLGQRNNCFDGLNATDNHYLKEKWNKLVNYQVTTHQRLECFPALKKNPH